MRRKLPDSMLKVLLVLLLITALVCVRAFEDVLFYDPFYDYFKNDYLNSAFPKYDLLQLFCGMAFRYFLNSILSLAIIYVIFSDFPLAKFTAVLYLMFFFMLIIALFGVLHFSDSGNNFLLFYIRRFLIQPLFLLLFIPAFYYQKQQLKK